MTLSEHDVDALARALVALGIDPAHARDGFRAANPFVVAVMLAWLGYRVLPSRRGIIKKPHIAEFQNRASTNPAKLVQWQSKFARSNPNWSILTGRVNGVWILDIDGPEGRARLAELESKLGPLPETVTVISGREEGGAHYWFAPSPEGPDLKTVAHAMILGERGKIDQKGRGGHAVTPGSLHASLKSYKWAEGRAPDEVALASLSAEWLAALDMCGDTAPLRPRTRGTSTGPRERIAHESSDVIGDGEGRGGFNRPIYVWCCKFLAEFGAGRNANRFKEALRKLIMDAPRFPDRSPDEIVRYASDEYLDSQIANARAFVGSNSK
jgi:hypothetical protein